MTLIISIIPKETSVINTQTLEDRLPAPRTNLFGMESWRYAVWGHDVIRNLGCTMLASLKTTNIYAFDEELDKLRTELEIIQTQHHHIVAQIGFDEQQAAAILVRVGNALAMLRIVDSERSCFGISIE
ncbi:MAG: hypothetical protein EAZ92_11230 [Candidatus Kapaibacterium sp.]|nr:MAG: hypothetical protein EAZ92_11230 [Candidatus Kapabacteria bacterium]